jgi:hypothetical protein
MGKGKPLTTKQKEANLAKAKAKALQDSLEQAANGKKKTF